MTCPTCQHPLVHTPHAPSESKPYVGSFFWCMDCNDWFVVTVLDPMEIARADGNDFSRIGGLGRSALMICVQKLTAGTMANKLKESTKPRQPKETRANDSQETPQEVR